MTKEERLYGKRQIEALFGKGKTFYQHPFRIYWLGVEEYGGPPARILISVPKRKFRLAYRRNRLKRLIREAYRKNKPMLMGDGEGDHRQLLIAFIYNGSTILSYTEIERKIILILQRLTEQDAQAAG